jgi:hypothetical protein
MPERLASASVTNLLRNDIVSLGMTVAGQPDAGVI